MSEMPKTPDVESAPGAPAETPEVQPETAPKINMDAIEAATDAHADALDTAHENLNTRMAAAYAEFHSDLDRAYTTWENAVRDAKSVTQFFSQEEVSEHGSTDPTVAR